MKHVKPKEPTDADLKGNPLIGGSKGTTLAGTSPDDLEDFEGETTIEGDRANDTNAYGGIAKSEARGGPANQVVTPGHKPRHSD